MLMIVTLETGREFMSILPETLYRYDTATPAGAPMLNTRQAHTHVVRHHVWLSADTLPPTDWS
jgi:hypothetical protein